MAVEGKDCRGGLFEPTGLLQARMLLGRTLLSCMQAEDMPLDWIVHGSVLLKSLNQESELADIGANADSTDLSQ